MKDREYLWNLPISCLSLNQISSKIISWALKKESRIVYCCGMNDIVLAEEDNDLKKTLKNSDLLTADGMPLVFLIRKKRKEKIERGYGPDIFKKVLRMSSNKKIGHFFLGTTDDNLKKITDIVKTDFGNKNILKYYAPPFKKEFNESDLGKMADLISDKNINIVWIGMGGAKQIFLADALKKRTKGKVFVTVGAAFDFLTGNKRQAPILIQKIGLEWLFRLISEPKRLTPRYLKIIKFMLTKTYYRYNQ